MTRRYATATLDGSRLPPERQAGLHTRRRPSGCLQSPRPSATLFGKPSKSRHFPFLVYCRCWAPFRQSKPARINRMTLPTASTLSQLTRNTREKAPQGEKKKEAPNEAQQFQKTKSTKIVDGITGDTRQQIHTTLNTMPYPHV